MNFPCKLSQHSYSTLPHLPSGMASQLHRQAALTSTLQAHEEKEWPVTVSPVRSEQNAEGQLRQGIVDIDTNGNRSTTNEVTVPAVDNQDFDTSDEDKDPELQRTLRIMRKKAEKEDRRFTNGNWQEAARLAELPKPPSFKPIVVGGKGLFKNSHDITSFLGTTEDYPTSTVYELPSELISDLWDARAAGEIGDDLVRAKADTLPTISICEVDAYVVFLLESMTKFETRTIWLHGSTRNALLIKSLREVKQHCTTDEPAFPSKSPDSTEFPVIIGNLSGDESMFETIEDLRRYLSLPEAPPVVKTVQTDVDMSDKLTEYDDGTSKHLPQLVAFVNATQLRQIEKATIGSCMFVWFPGNTPRLAWFPTSPKEETEAEDTVIDINQETEIASNAATAGHTEGCSTTAKRQENDFVDSIDAVEGQHSSCKTDNDAVVGQDSHFHDRQDTVTEKVTADDTIEPAGCGLRPCVKMKDIFNRIMMKFKIGQGKTAARAKRA
ncbi:hypothetical protein V8F20_005114 [Naviculisporaceae sp. PSN 640]